MNPPAPPRRLPRTRPVRTPQRTPLLALLLLAACSNGGSDPAPARINQSPTVLAPPEVTGTFPVYSATVRTDQTATLTFAGVDADGDAVQWSAQVLAGDALASGLTFPPTATTSLTFTLAAVPAAAEVVVAMTTTDGRAETTAFLVVDRAPSPVLPQLARVEPDSAFLDVVQRITVHGSGFTAAGAGANLVTIGANPATGVETASDSELHCTTPTRTTTGPVDVAMSNGNGSATPLAGALTYFSFPPRWSHAPVAAGAQGTSLVRLARDGTQIYCASAVPGAPGTVFVMRSTDRGTTWSQTIARQATGSISQVGIAAAEGKVFLAWIESSRLHVRRSLDEGQTFAAPGSGSGYPSTGYAVAPNSPLELETDGVLVNLVADASAPGASAPDLAQSTDGGETWSGLHVAPAGSSHDFAVANGRTFLVHRSATTGDLLFNHSLDGGRSWQPVPQVLGPGNRASVLARGSEVFVAWGNGDLHIARSGNAGSIPLEVLSLQGPTTGSVIETYDPSTPPALVYADDAIHVAGLRSDDRDLGITVATYKPGVRLVRTEIPQLPLTSSELQLVVSGNYRHLAWVSGSAGSRRIQLLSEEPRLPQSLWRTSTLPLTGAVDTVGPRLLADGARVFAAWNDVAGALVARSSEQ